MEPFAQLLMVPRGLRPLGSALVRSSRWPAAGPDTVIAVLAVIRRLRRERTTCHEPLPIVVPVAMMRATKPQTQDGTPPRC